MLAAEERETRQIVDIAVVAAALLVSLVLVQLVAGSTTVTVAFAAGLVVLGLVAFAAVRRRSHQAAGGGSAMADWSVTLAAIEQPDLGVAITDRANRLICASSAFQEWFGTSAPPRLAVDDGSADLLARAARAAWRDGAAESDGIIGDGDRRWSMAAVRAGLGDEYLIWRFVLIRQAEVDEAIGRQISGLLGRALGDAGVAAALVAPDGSIRAANPAFALGAAGEESAKLTGQDAAGLLRSEERGTVRYAHGGGVPQMLVEVPLVERAKTAGKAVVEASDASRLMLLMDPGICPSLAEEGAEGGGGQAAQLEALIERLPLGLAATNRDGRFLFANPAFRRAATVGAKGLPPYPSDLVARADKTMLADAVRRFAQGPATSSDIAVRLASSPEEPVSIGLNGVRGIGEVAVLLSLADMTEENRLKRQVAQATKMQAVGQLAGGVAHDFNNVLTAVIGHCDLMLERHAPGDADYDDIQQIKSNSNRAASLTRQLLAFSRQQKLKPEIIQLPDVLSEMMQLLRRLLGARITLDVHHHRDLGPVRADPRQLEQVIMNLAVNARDAIQQHGGGEQAAGTLSFATRRADAGDIRQLESEIIPPGDYTVLVVEDTGGGIPRRVIGKIFEPFFTTKEQGKGTGLGLSTVYGIIKQSGGFIFAENVPGDGNKARGARFTIYLPVHAVGPGETVNGRSPLPKPEERTREFSGGGRILLVEDEDTVRAVAERALARAGYTVVTARDGEEGLEAFASGGHFDLIVSDVVMPGIDGPAMARAIRQTAPEVPVLFMSGYAEEKLRDEIDIEAMHFIAKPFSLREIADKAGEAIAAHARH